MTVNEYYNDFQWQRRDRQCYFCENDVDIIAFRGRFVCQKCVEAIYNSIGNVSQPSAEDSLLVNEGAAPGYKNSR